MRSDPNKVLNTKDGSSGPWEKFKMTEMIENGKAYFAMKSVFDNYVTCEANGDGTTSSKSFSDPNS